MSGYDDVDRERWAPEPPKRATRTAFERDRARVLHSASLRRLAAKTQVVAPESDDFVRNRLTHSLEVAQVGRELGKVLGCDPDVVDTACLAHDLGHPPFGHNGEEVLDDIAASIGGFEGNAQTLRLLSRLEAKAAHPDGRPAGLNLTRASLDAATKYPWRREGAARDGKFGVYDDDTTVFAWVRQRGDDGHRCLEAQVMDFADDVAYSVHDVEDAIVAERIKPDRLDDPEERQRLAELTHAWYVPDAELDEITDGIDRLRQLPYWVDRYDGRLHALAGLKDMTSQLIGRFCDAAKLATHAAHGEGNLSRYAADLEVPRGTRIEVAGLKGLAALYVMTAEDRAPVYGLQREMIEELVSALRLRAPESLEPTFAEAWERTTDDATRLRVVIDQVASLTDGSAYTWHARLLR